MSQWEGLADWFISIGGRIVAADDDGKIVYIGSDVMSQFDGMLGVPFNKMPVRILFIPKDRSMKVRLDEDWGFQKFMARQISLQ